MNRHLSLMCAVSIAAALAPAGVSVRAQGASARDGATLPPMTFNTDTGQKIRVVTVARGLVHPHGIAVLPDARTILVAERGGRLLVIKDGLLLPTPAWEGPTHVDPVTMMAEGLHFIALHPRFAENHLIYISYPKPGDRGDTVAVGRGTFDGAKLTDFQEIFVADAWETGSVDPGRLLFGPDNTLYVTVGDRDRKCCDGTDDNSLRMRAQSPDNDYGKTLRIRDDGSIPPDNPFVGRAGARPEIFTYGHRNGYGLAFHPETRQLWQAEIGPMGGDEINILVAGHNYGWPLVSTGRNYTGTEVSDQPWFRSGMDNPRMFWVPAISPSSLMFYTGDRFKGWKDNMFVGALNGKALVRVAFNQPGMAEHRETLLASLDARIRDVQQGPDGYIYLCTELVPKGAEPDGTVLRIEPAP
jgi:glucose/arabinose dehydrogenase